MEAGALRHRITIQTPTETEGTKGQPVIVWKPFRQRIAAEVRALSGAELFNAQQTQADVTFSVSLRWFYGVTSKMRILWHDSPCDRTLAILVPPINPDGKKVEMRLLCKEPE